MLQLDQDRNVWTPAQIVQCPKREGRLYNLKTIHGGIYTRNSRFIKPDLIEAMPPTMLPEPEERMGSLPPRPPRAIKKPNRLIESKLTHTIHSGL